METSYKPLWILKSGELMFFSFKACSNILILFSMTMKYNPSWCFTNEEWSPHRVLYVNA